MSLFWQYINYFFYIQKKYYIKYNILKYSYKTTTQIRLCLFTWERFAEAQFYGQDYQDQHVAIFDI